MTTNNQTRGVNEHLELELSKHEERSYLSTLLASRPQFLASNLSAELQAETERWMPLLSTASAETFLQTFEGIKYVFDALKHESRALTDIEKAIVAQGKHEWAEAGTFYGKAVSDLHFALSDWTFAIGQIADDSPFDPYYPTKAERAQHGVEDPPRSSYKEMCGTSASLFQIYRNLDRVFCIGQEIAQRQITCLTNYMQEAEGRDAGRSST